jgi:hypothetical protein
VVRHRRPIVRFICLFALVYGALIAPWPGWNSLYGRGFRVLCSACLATENGLEIIRVQAAEPNARLDTQILLIDPARKNSDGKIPVRILGLDSRGVGWIPTALFMALTIAAPVSTRRKGWALGLGLLAVHVYLLLMVEIYIWNESIPAAAGAVSLLKQIGNGLEETLVTQLGASFVVPTIIWLLVTFRKSDLDAVQALLETRSKPH